MTAHLNRRVAGVSARLEFAECRPKCTQGEPERNSAEPRYSRCRVAVAVCTANRPEMLRLCLDLIGSQVVPPRVIVDVVVVDNEDAPNNHEVVQSFSGLAGFPVHYVHEPRRGISRARNAALEKCRSLDVDWIAFTDDDCRVSPTWLASLLGGAGRYGADVVYGRREFLCLEPMPFWAMRLERDICAEGQLLTRAATHNVLLATRLLGEGDASMWFDERLAHGEDTDFFHRLALQGARIVYSAEALVLEVVTGRRATLRYHMRRSYYQAASRSHFHRRHKGPVKAILKLTNRCAVQAPVAMARLVVAPLVWLFSEQVSRGLVTKGIGRLAGAAGAAAGLLGFDGDPYRRIDGY